MKYPVIRVRDRSTGHERIVGENIHDELYVDRESGGIQYLNSQCCRGTDGDDAEYEFIGEDKGEWSITMQPEIEFVTLDRLIDMASEHLEKATREKIKSYRALKKCMDEEMNKCREETGIRFDTGGMLP